MSSFCICKSYSHFFQKNTCEFGIVLTITVNILTTNELVKLTMLWTTGPGFCSPFIFSVVYNDSVSRQWRPWSDCAVWSGPSLSAHDPQGTFSLGGAHVFTVFTLSTVNTYIWWSIYFGTIGDQGNNRQNKLLQFSMKVYSVTYIWKYEYT